MRLVSIFYLSSRVTTNDAGKMPLFPLHSPSSHSSFTEEGNIHRHENFKWKRQDISEFLANPYFLPLDRIVMMSPWAKFRSSGVNVS